MINRWYISDHHLWHENIIKFCKRPFSSVQEMNEALLERHNATIRPEDHVSFLGDVTLLRKGKKERDVFIAEMHKYNGHKRLYLGNHDHFNIQTYLAAGFERIYATWRTEEGFLISHIPVHPRSLLTATANVHGHVHNNERPFDPVVFTGKELPYDPREPRVVPYINLSVEVINYTPVHLDEILGRIKQCQTS